ncbi:hypothetical protein FRZ67_11400 [Panacibacter ginsenosidivorans]|uniref:Uncharacterized protein n=1 Tax=Panacibacter ginsenosidivorans TaxID=1813871 RepID=A0A5B8V8Y1_9BACT|nr:hypothetical protein [Panacibacter ginsenosidivorans]QEC67874.1 hypothetical protein FRZ67_11400 [Panacibacter ginsenosidivorans]
MNSSQLLYKISTLEHSISRKELEYNSSLRANDQPNIALHKAALLQLKEELAATRKQFDTVQTDNSKATPPPPKKSRKWPSFFGFRTATDNE